jgi:hypothetical protein
MTAKKTMDSMDGMDNENTVDAGAIMETMQRQMAAMQAEMARMKAVQDDPHRIARDGLVVVTQADIRAFLDEPIQPNVFWAENPSPVLCLRMDEKTFDSNLRQEKISRTFFATFHRWFGVGEELRRNDGSLIYPRGIGRYAFATTDPDAEVLLKRLTARTDPAELPRIYTDAEWKLRMKAEYESRNAARAIQEKYRQQMAELQTGAVEGDPKAGI